MGIVVRRYTDRSARAGSEYGGYLVLDIFLFRVVVASLAQILVKLAEVASEPARVYGGGDDIGIVSVHFCPPDLAVFADSFEVAGDLGVVADGHILPGCSNRICAILSAFEEGEWLAFAAVFNP